MTPLLLLAACADPDTGGSPDAVADAPQDVLETDLSLDLDALRGDATVRVRASAHGVVQLHVGDLQLDHLEVDGEPVDTRASEGLLKLSTGRGEHEISADYTFSAHEDFTGWMPSRGLSFTWPYWCGNLFPCNPEVSDGLRFSLSVSGYDGVAVYPEQIPADAPPYMLGIAVGDYTEAELGQTTAGTRLSVWTLPGGEEDGQVGTKDLVSAFDYYERTYGPYTFGDHAGSVAADWDDVGGMEHHPFWHIALLSMRSEEAHVHEAGHAWFGDGVRLACWEDLVLSEGTTTYITRRALDQVGGPDVTPIYLEELGYFCDDGGYGNAIALPDTCGEIDIQTDPLWSMVPYMKGACFYQDVATLIGADDLDEIIAEFYATHVGSAARMQDMLDLLEERAPPGQRDALRTLEDEWLRTLACPADYAARCG